MPMRAGALNLFHGGWRILLSLPRELVPVNVRDTTLRRLGAHTPSNWKRACKRLRKRPGHGAG